jgi:hypothetical protein
MDLVWTDVSEDVSPPSSGKENQPDTKNVLVTLLLAANDVSSSLILSTLMMEAILSFETSVPEDLLLQFLELSI